MSEMKWPYPAKVSQVNRMEADVIVLGGGIAGCMAAINAAKRGQSVILVEKGATKRSGAGGSGCDHWESAATNPCSGVSPEDLVQAMLDDNDGYNNGISHYIECREGWDHLQDIEKMGGKIRDTEDEFKGAAFRDEKTKLMFAYDYKNKFTIRIWGTTFKPAMEKECRRLGVKIVDRVMVTSLLTEGGENGAKCVGATGVHTRTGEFYVFSSKAAIITMSRPARVWLFSAAYPGLCEFRPMCTIGDGHAMGWRAGAEFNMMEKSVRAEFSSAGRSFPPYSAGNNHNTWYPASLIDAEGKEIPYADRDGNILTDVEQRFQPAKGQHYFLKGGNIEQAKYAYDGPETLPYDKLKEMGYKLPFYADLSNMPELERKVIWGMMVGQEGKTNVPVYKNFTEAGFDPTKDVLQCYGVGWTSAEFLRPCRLHRRLRRAQGRSLRREAGGLHRSLRDPGGERDGARLRAAGRRPCQRRQLEGAERGHRQGHAELLRRAEARRAAAVRRGVAEPLRKGDRAPHLRRLSPRADASAGGVRHPDGGSDHPAGLPGPPPDLPQAGVLPHRRRRQGHGSLHLHPQRRREGGSP